MSDELVHIRRCLDLQERDIVDAVVSRQRASALLAHLAAVSAPDTGAAKALLVFARMATTACDWLDGDLSIDLHAQGDATRVAVTTELGGGLKERVFASLTFQAPLVEFARAIDRVARMIAPLRVSVRTAQRLALGASGVVRRTSLPPPPIEISADSLFLAPPPHAIPSDDAMEAMPISLPVVNSVAPIVLTTVEPPPPAPGRGASDPPLSDLDSGWDD